MFSKEIKNAFVSNGVKNMSCVQCTFHFWASTRDNLSSGYANNKDADQPACMRSLVKAFVIHLLASCFKRNVNFLASLCSRGDWFESRLVGNPGDRYCRVEAQLLSTHLLSRYPA